MPLSTNPGCLSLLNPLRGKTAAAKSKPDLPYRLRDDFLSPAEMAFYHALTPILGEQLTACPKVSLDDVFFVSRPDQNKAAWNKINRKHVDFLVCSAHSLRPLFGIELDDSSHQREDRIERDQFVNQVFQAAGLPLAHVPVRASYDPAELKRIFNQALRSGIGQAPAAASTPPVAVGEGAPLCPKCGVPMVLRTARAGVNAGKQFYGCPNYPRCREMRTIEG